MLKILAITGNRADYDLLSPLYCYLHQDPNIDLQLLVSGGHLVKSYGYSIKSIHEDGFNILCQIESILHSDTKESRLKSASILFQNSIDMVANYDPDLILYVGDREDVLIGGLLGCYLEKTTVHFLGGDHAIDGNTDNTIRHATSKLSSVHMISLPIHRERLLKMGESAERIFYTGNIALENFVKNNPFSKKEIGKKLNLGNALDEFALLIYHPLPSERETYYQSFINILKALEAKQIFTFINAPNTDPGNHDGLNAINHFSEHPNFHFTKHLDRDLFLSIYKQAKFIIGNSSSGIVESASIPIPAINVGQRQRGRFSGSNVIFCGTELLNITQAISKACSQNFLKSIEGMQNPYGDGQGAKRAYDIIKKLDLKKFIYKNEDPILLPS